MQTFAEHRLEQQLLDRVTVESLPMAIMILSQESSFCYVLCTHQQNCPQKDIMHKELFSPETNLPCTRFLDIWFTLDVIQHQFLIVNTSAFLL